ncbi:hypothetical protein MAV100_25860 [Mycobacterium avium subsp. hominissuis 100]|nr:hypothetical protein MAV100_25860 [Mycobacterium avium subsp. hominissuis 100]
MFGTPAVGGGANGTPPAPAATGGVPAATGAGDDVTTC